MLHWQAVVIVALLITALTALTFYFTKRSFDVGDRMVNWPGRIADKLGKLFQTNVSVENNSFTLGQKDIAELAVVQRRIICTTKYQASWPGSEAIVIVQGVYTIKAGYDLKEGYHLTFDEHGRALSVQLPEPKVLSNTTESQKVIFDSQGVLKKLPPREMEVACAQNLNQAKLEANDLGLLDDARARIKKRLGDLIGDDAARINLASPKQ